MAEAKIIQATAADAQRWLAMNTENRRLSKIRSESMRGAMVRGEWKLSTDAIGIEGRGSHGRLINGQHRAQALLLADSDKPGITVPLVTMTGMDPDSGPVIDIGKARSLEDTLFYLGEAENKPRQLAAVVTLAWHIEHNTYWNRQPTPTRTQQLDYLKSEAPDLRDAVPLGSTMARGARVPASGLMAAVWLIGRGANVHWLDEFASQVAHGEGLTHRDMSYRLRELFASWTLTRNVDRGRPWKVCAITIRTWNAWLESKQLNLTQVRLNEIPDAL